MDKPTITTVTGQAQNNAFQVNTATDELATAITGALGRDGTDNMAGNLNMNNNKVRNLSAPIASTDAVRLADLTAITEGTEVAQLRTDLASTTDGEGIDLIGNSIKAVASYAALRLAAVNTELVFIRHRATAGDAGGGVFYWDSTSTDADNDGTILKVTAVTTGRWKRIYTGDVFGEWFGADNTGVADSQPACAAVLDLVDTLRLGAGTFKFSSTLFIHGQGKRFIGAGVGDTTISMGSGITGIVMGNSASPATSDTNHKQSISDMKLSAGAKCIQFGSETSPTSFLGQAMRMEITGGTTSGIELLGAQGATFQDLNIHSNAIGIRTVNVAATRTTASVFNRCRVYTNTAQGLYSEGMEGIAFRDCNFESNQEEGVKLAKQTGAALTNILFDKCWFEGNLASGTTSSASLVATAGGDASTVSDLDFRNCEFNGVTTPASNRHIIAAVDGFNVGPATRFLSALAPMVEVQTANCVGVINGNTTSEFTDNRDLTFIGRGLKVYGGYDIEVTDGVVESSGDASDHNKLLNANTSDGAVVLECKSSATSNALMHVLLNCGSDTNRMGLRWDLSGVGNTRMWFDDAGKCRINTANPTANTDGTVLGTQTFSGTHVYQSDIEYPLGAAVKLVNRKLKLCTTIKDKACIGVYAGKTNLKYDSFGDCDTPGHFVISIGDSILQHGSTEVEGVLVCDENGPIEVGDFLCTSNTPGYLMKQDDGILHNYTVAQAQEGAIFNPDGKAVLYTYLKK